MNQPLEDGVDEHAITAHSRTNVLPIATFWLTIPDHDLPLVLVDATGRPDFVDLFRVPEHTQLLRRIAGVGRFLLGADSAEDRAALDTWAMDGRLPSTVRAALDQW